MENHRRHVISEELNLGTLPLRRRGLLTALALCLLVACSDDDSPTQASKPVSQPAPQTQRPLLSKEEQTEQCRDHITKYSKGIFTSIRFFNVDDMLNADGKEREVGGYKFLPAPTEFLRFHACATEGRTNMPRYYTFGCNFSYYGQIYSGAPLSMVLYGPHEWPFKDSVLGPVFNMTPEKKAEEDASREQKDDYLETHPSPTAKYGTDPCNGQRVLIGH